MEFFPFDDDYVRRLRAGDRDTEEHFRSFFEPRLVSKFRNRANRDDIPDLVQNVFIAVFDNLSRDKGPLDGRKLAAWVFGIAGHVLSGWYRDHKHPEEPLDDAKHRFARDNHIVETLIDNETKEKIRRVLDSLRPPRDAEVLRAIFIDERDKDEVCAEFGVDRDYLRVILYRARVRFRAEFTAPPKPTPPKRGELKRFPADRH